MDYFKGLQNSGKVPEKDLKTYVLSAVQVTRVPTKQGRGFFRLWLAFVLPFLSMDAQLGLNLWSLEAQVKVVPLAP